MQINFSKQFSDGAKAAGNVKISGGFDRVVFCGMGGSAIPGEMISMLWINGLNCYINRGFGLPNWVDENCLTVCASWSGDTEETVSSLNKTTARKIPVAAVADKGKLLDLAKKNDLPFVDLPAMEVPARFAVGQILAAILTLLHNSDIIDYSLPNELDCQPVGPDFSSRINDKTPLIYSSYQWRYLARFWKIHFNENCKIHAFSNFFPEAAHNEIAGFEESAKNSYFPIILTDPEEEKADILKLEKFASFLKNSGIDCEIVEITGRNRLEKIIKNYNQAIAVSVSLAKTKNVDPFDTAVVEKFKKL